MGKTLIYRTIGILIILLISSTTGYFQVADSLVYSGKTAFNKRENRALTLHAENQIIIVKPSAQNASVNFCVFDAETLALKDEFSWISENRDNRFFRVISVSYFNGQILILSGVVNNKEKTEHVWLNTINIKGEEISSLEVDHRENTSPFNDIKYEVFESDGQEFMGVASVNESFNGNKFEIRLHVYNSKLVKLSTHSLSIPNIKKVNFPRSFTIDKKSTIYFLNGLQETKGDEYRSIGLEKRLYQLFRFNPIDETLKQYDVSIADKYISDVKMKINPEGNLVVLGFYNNTFEKAAEGLFTMVIGHKSGEVLLSGKKPLNQNIITDFKSEKQANKNPSVNNLYLDNFYFNKKGNIILLAEVFELEQRLMQNVTGMNITTSNYYNFDEILALEIEANLSYVKHHTIHKRQKSINFINPYWGYSVLNSEEPENLKVVYNYATPKNKRNALTVISETRTRTWSQPIFSTQPMAIEADYNLKVTPQFSPNQLNEVVVLQNKNEFRLAKLVPKKN